jgi:hypothetical protein
MIAVAEKGPAKNKPRKGIERGLPVQVQLPPILVPSGSVIFHLRLSAFICGLPAVSKSHFSRR